MAFKGRAFFFSHKDWSCQRGGQRDTQPPPTKLYTHYSTACLRTSVSISFYHTRVQFEKPGIPASMKFLKSWISTHRPNPTKTKSNMKLCLEIYISQNLAAWHYVEKTILPGGIWWVMSVSEILVVKWPFSLKPTSPPSKTWLIKANKCQRLLDNLSNSTTQRQNTIRVTLMMLK